MGSRLEEDVESVRRCNQPGLVLHHDSGGKPYWRGHVRLQLPSKELEIELEIIYPVHYPRQLPRVKDVRGHYRIDGKRHIERDHTFCLTPMAVGEEIPIHEPYGFEKFLQSVFGFLVRQEQYEITGKWPGPAAAHGVEGLIRYHQQRCFPYQPDCETTLKLIDEWRRGPKESGPLKIKRGLGPNAKCPCGSGHKLKKCHGPVVERVVQRCNETYYDLQVHPNLRM